MSSSPSTPTALPTAEAIEILLSPDGYYKYLGIPRPTNIDALGPKFKEAMSASESNNDESTIDLDQVKKNYRRLSLRHHPDRKTGDAETFRMLNRAKVVLSNAKLRREYDLVGLDLDDDAEDHAEDGGGSASDANNNSSEGDIKKEGGTDNNKNASTSKDSSSGTSEEGSGGSSKTETVMSHLASVTLAAIMQIFVRTGLLGTVSVLISRYIILTLPAMGVLAYISYKIHSTLKATLKENKLSFPISKDALSPLAIAFGLFCMYRGRRFAVLVVAAVVDNAIVGDTTAVETAATTLVTYLDWSWTFWFGEALVMTMFLMNSFDSKQPRAVIVAFVTVSLLFTLWLRGRFWRYATILFFEAVIAALCVLVFPIMEMILESIVEDKMRKVGEKIRAHDKRMKELLMKKKKEQSG
jgi:hypothetical protein